MFQERKKETGSSRRGNLDFDKTFKAVSSLFLLFDPAQTFYVELPFQLSKNVRNVLLSRLSAEILSVKARKLAEKPALRKDAILAKLPLFEAQ